MKHFPAVEELRVVGCVVTEMSDLQKLATSFPRLDKLKMGEVLILEDSESDLVPLHRATLSSLRVPSRFVDNRKSATHFLDWMMEESLHMNIDTLEMPIFYPHEALSVDNFLRERGTALKNLCLHMEPQTPETGTFVCIELSTTSECGSFRLTASDTPLASPVYGPAKPKLLRLEIAFRRRTRRYSTSELPAHHPLPGPLAYPSTDPFPHSCRRRCP